MVKAERRSASRKVRGWFTAGVIGLLSVGLAGVGPVAHAKDLNSEKSAVQTKINANKKAQTAAEAKVQQANAALQDSQKKLADAQADLATKQQASKDAQAEDTRLAGQLADAERALANRKQDVLTAQAAVSHGEADMASQRDHIGLVAQTSAQQNTTLVALSMFFADFNTAQINNRVQWISTVFTANQQAMDALVAAQVRLEAAKTTAQQAEFAAAAAEATAQTNRSAAAAHLGVTKQAEQAALQAQGSVATQVTANEQAKADAQAALNAAKAEDAKLQAELAQIEAAIKEQIKQDQNKENQNNNSKPPVVNKPAPSTGTFFYRPTGGSLTSPYGWRMHPILHVMKFHSGVDLGVGCGTPVHAAEAGTVTQASWYGGYGNYLLINNGKISGANYSTGYGHLSKFVVSAGQHVTRGQVVAYSGTTGASTGCHLHFETFKNGSTVNPWPLIT
ncbi:MAG: peptidoglycan DD-metalloendopeptidase family protein [Propionibacteriaceae bacterium]|nr:peptidoglycan DD-metalloendopeptidase family protein [Propionibacteriaceae bacterium]